MAEARARPPAATVRREQAHRRSILLGLSVLLLLGMSPLLGHHLPFGFDQALEGRDHLWALCLIALHAILAPVHAGFHALFVAGLAYAGWDRFRAWRSLGRALAPFGALPPEPGSAIWRAAAAAGVDRNRVLVVPGLPSPAFTAGWLRPRVYVAAAVVERLSGEELAAVLAHEGSHVRRRDPLRLSVLRFLACTLFWLPALRRLATDIAAEGEVRADDLAAERHGLALASALVRLAAWEPAAETLGVGFTGGDLLERRVLRLTGEEIAPKSHVTRRSLAGATAALLLAGLAGAVVAHPMPDGHDAHCDGHARAAVFHLFCDACMHDASAYCPWGHARH
jgi:Zn-dependent protease with chaperone function